MSGSGGVNQLVTQLRRSFPATVTAETLKKLSIAPNNETYVLNIMRFIGVLDSENKKSAVSGPIFNKHDDTEFQEGFTKLVADAYKELFDLHGPSAWTLSQDKLISFFRTNDETSNVVGTRQASTFQALARISGKLEDAAPATPSAKTRTANPSAPKVTKKTSIKAPVVESQTPPKSGIDVKSTTTDGKRSLQPGMALTVRIEINLPAGGDQSTYDYIFKSIRENLIDGNGS